jgi:DNA-binding CsgD family transcriptional regulator
MRLLCGLSDLTPARPRVARGIASARPPEAVARSVGISVKTARLHLKRIMLKTGPTRKAKLLLLLLRSGLRPPGKRVGAAPYGRHWMRAMKWRPPLDLPMMGSLT